MATLNSRLRTKVGHCRAGTTDVSVDSIFIKLRVRVFKVCAWFDHAIDIDIRVILQSDYGILAFTNIFVGYFRL